MNPNSGKDLSAIWLAGVIDGEGCIVYNRAPFGKKAPGFHVSIINSSVNFLREVQTAVRLLTGRVFKIRHHCASSLSKKECWLLTVSRSSSVLQLLPWILPYLVIKRPQAAFAFAALDFRRRAHERQGGHLGIEYTKVCCFMTDCGERLKWFNQHGLIPSQVLHLPWMDERCREQTGSAC